MEAAGAGSPDRIPQHCGLLTQLKVSCSLPTPRLARFAPSRLSLIQCLCFNHGYKSCAQVCLIAHHARLYTAVGQGRQEPAHQGLCDCQQPHRAGQNGAEIRQTGQSAEGELPGPVLVLAQATMLSLLMATA